MSTYTRAFAGLSAVLILIPDCGCSADAVAPIINEGVPRTGGASSLGSGGTPNENGGSASGGDFAGGSSGDATDGGTSSTGGASVDGGAATDGGTPGSGGNPTTGGAPDAGGAPTSGGAGPGDPVETPGVVLCGEATCDLKASSGNACCVRTTIFASRCGNALTACALNGGMTFTCDDTSDCEDGKVCCSFYLNGVTTTQCETSCAGLGAPKQLCRSDAQCGDKKCAPSDVIAEYNVCQ